MSRIAAPFLIAALVVAAACNKPSPSGTSAPAQSSADKPAAAATPAAALGVPPKPVPQTLPDVLARVNDQPVNKSDFEMLVRNVEHRGPIPPERRDEILRALLDQLVEYTVLKQEAAARNIQVTDAEVEQQITLMKQQSGGEEGFKKQLSERKMTLERLRADMRAQMAISKMLEAQAATAAPVTDADAKAFYEKNPDKFKRGESVRASHILIRVSEQASEPEKKKARAQIDAVLKRARAGEDFAVLAREHSQDGSAAQGGDLSYFVKGQMVEPFDKVAFSLKPNEISDVVATQFGYHIIKVVDRKPAGSVPLDEVAENLKRVLSEQRKQETAQAFINQIKQKSKVEVLI